MADLDTEGAGGPAPAPHDACTLNGLSLWMVETRHTIDGWKYGSHEPQLASFRFDAPGTDSFKYEGDYHPEDKRCCYERCNPTVALAKPRAGVPNGMREYELCIPAPESTQFPANGAKQCAAALRTRNTFPDGKLDPLDDAPFVRANRDECCYMVASPHRCPPNTFENGDRCDSPSPGGRPLREHGTAVSAPARERGEWQLPIAIGTQWTAAQREQAAAAWAREAAFEHASVAAFARLAIDLMIHAAPAELVDAAHAAARDEIRHAQQCYGIASAFGGASIGPGRLPLSTHGNAPSLVALAVDCFRDGCVDELVAALAVAEAARRAAPELRATLEAIADDELRHAELSYRILAWTLRTGDATLRARLRDELAAIAAEPRRTAEDAHRDETIGLLAPATAAELRQRVIAQVVVPCTQALLETELLVG